MRHLDHLTLHYIFDGLVAGGWSTEQLKQKRGLIFQQYYPTTFPSPSYTSRCNALQTAPLILVPVSFTYQLAIPPPTQPLALLLPLPAPHERPFFQSFQLGLGPFSS